MAMAQWTDGFEGYTPGPLTPQGGWQIWYSGGDDGTVVDTNAHTGTQALRLELPNDEQFGTDVVQTFDIAGGQWVFTIWTYVPADAGGLFNRDGYVILMNNYNGAPELLLGDNWSMQVRFSAGDLLVESQFDGNTLPLVTDQWVELRAEIDLVADSFDLYYGGSLLAENLVWTENVSGGGGLTIASLDLFSDTISGMLFDDVSLVPAGGGGCEGDLDGDGDTDQSDLGIILAAYGINGDGDLDGDNDTDQSDLGILLADYGCQ
jgi:hypothetical protein